MYDRGPSCFFLVVTVLSLGIDVHCKQCGMGEYPYWNTCHPCPITCRACTPESLCKRCTYDMWGTTVYCSSICKESAVCSKGCKDGYFIVPGNYCISCPYGCLKCTSFLTCETCITGRWGVVCQLGCSRGCSECFGSSNTQCMKCKDGKYGENCDQTCSKNCETVHGDVGVTTCNMYNGSCNNGCMGNYTGEKCDDKTPNIGSGITPSPSEHHIENQTNIAMLVGVAIGGLFILIAAGFIVVCIVIRQSKPSPLQNTEEEMPTSTSDIVYNPIYHDYTNTGNQEASLPAPHRMQYTEVDPEEIEFDKGSDESTVFIGIENTADFSIYNTNVAGLTRKRIQVDQLQDYVANKTNNEIKDEFQKLPQGLTRPYTDASQPANVGKNRYRSIYPYDVTRVKLIAGAFDFINASYIDGYDELKVYIASQGPTASTMNNFVDFWRMVWQEKVEKIVMLTNLIEDKKMKCEQYWPNERTCLSYGDVMVTCHSEDTYAEYTVNSLTISKGPVKRSLHHLHFAAWPDKRVPDSVTSLIEFRQKVESIHAELGGPVIVHCSAGVGRTGTYIALDILTKEGIAERSVDILGCVIGLRNQRVSMVQTEEQYRFLHNSVVHALTFDCQAIQGDTFRQYLSNNYEKLCSQFEQISATGEKKSMEETNSSIHDKNRKDAEVPGDRHRPRLHHGRKPGSSDYINATFINSFRSKNRFIITQTPLPCTMVDFLTLILQENCSCIVSMDADLLSDMTVGVYLPGADQTLKDGDFQISCRASESTPHYILRKLSIQQQNWLEEKTVNHFQLTCWMKTSPVPNDTLTFIKCIQDVEKKEFTNMGPIVIHCLNGAERSGLFCAVSVLIQKMEIDHEVSVVNTVRQIKSRRGGAIPNKEQYIFCHKCIAAFLQTSDNYSNLSLQD